ncbi:MAG: sigma-70 family RNA polymerase sigma factor [Deltaproteobacteria bacterium]|nr:sigma-70 family RNA polymerase sigma factor [Deltaproteobacteria bacterium]
MESRDITILLQAWQEGESGAADRLFERIYPELRRIADRQLRLRENVTFQPTELVNEAYLKLEANGSLRWENRLQFFALAAKILRQILVDRFRNKATLKRGSACKTVALEEVELPAVDLDFLALDQALERLADLDPEAAQFVELRYFGGLTIPEIADFLGLGTATVSRRWQMARAWLRSELH